MPDARFAFPQIGIELRIFERDGGLARQQFQYRDPTGGEGMRNEIVFQVKQTDQHGLPQDRQAQH